MPPLNANLTLLLLLLSQLLAPLNGDQERDHTEIPKIIESFGTSPSQSALVIMRLEDQSLWTSGGPRIKTRFPTGCTSKIPETLIALETGYVSGPDAFFKWDGVERFLDAWNCDQTLTSAFQCSAVWVFQQIMQGIGYETLSFWIDRFNYGNCDLGHPDSFWLREPILISANEQVDFLKKLAQKNLPLKPAVFEMAKEVMVEKSGDNWKLYSKTGYQPDAKIGWYVGWIENGKSTYVFAFNMEINHWDELPKRKEIVIAVFKHLGVLP